MSDSSVDAGQDRQLAPAHEFLADAHVGPLTRLGRRKHPASRDGRRGPLLALACTVTDNQVTVKAKPSRGIQWKHLKVYTDRQLRAQPQARSCPRGDHRCERSFPLA